MNLLADVEVAHSSGTVDDQGDGGSHSLVRTEEVF